MNSREVSWAWVTADRVLSHRPCELIFAFAVASGATSDSGLYDGENTQGVLVTKLASAGAGVISFQPSVPVYCDRGLYVDVGSNILGIFVQWRELPYGG